MEWINKVEEIKKQLLSNGFSQLEKEIEDAQMVLGTPGEMFLSVVAKLKDIKEHHKDAYVKVENDVEDIFRYGKSIGYLSGDY